MKCPRCQHENPQGARFCEECASPLARTCSNCGTALSATAKFCHACAHPTSCSDTSAASTAPAVDNNPNLLARARQQAVSVQCLSNLKQIAQAAHLYAAENRGFFPTAQVDSIESLTGGGNIASSRFG